MAIYTVQDTTMTALGDAVRSKTVQTRLEEQVFDFDIPIKISIDLSTMDSSDFELCDDNYYRFYLLVCPYINGLYRYKITYSYSTDTLNAFYGALNMYEAPIFDNSTPYTSLLNLTDSRVENKSYWRAVSSAYTIGHKYLGFIGEISKDYFDTGVGKESKLDVEIYPLNNSDEVMTSHIVEVINTMTPAEMVDAIDGLICLTEDDLILTNAYYLSYNGTWDNIIQKTGNHLILQNCYNLYWTFYGSKLEDLSMITIDGGYNQLQATFQNCSNLKYLPTVKSYSCQSLDNTFNSCYRLRSLGNFFDNITISNNRNTTSSWGSVFSACYSLRTIPQKVLNALWNNYRYSYGSVYNTCFRYCYTLDEIIGLGVNSSYSYTPTQNYFQNTFAYCSRLKDMTFLTNEDGTPISSNMINQTIDLSVYVGYGNSENNILNYNSGITADKKVYDDATYVSLKDDPDWYSLDINYSRYNHDSAVNTINSLPDVSAYGTSTIKFQGSAGALTDGGAINTLTEEEIAVATAKGWTVSLV